MDLLEAAEELLWHWALDQADAEKLDWKIVIPWRKSWKYGYIPGANTFPGETTLCGIRGYYLSDPYGFQSFNLTLTIDRRAFRERLTIDYNWPDVEALYVILGLPMAWLALVPAPIMAGLSGPSSLDLSLDNEYHEARMQRNLGGR